MIPPDDVTEAFNRDGVYLAPMRPTDGDREYAHHLSALISIHWLSRKNRDGAMPQPYWGFQ